MLGVENNVGLTTVLVGDLGLDDAIQQHAQTGLAVLAAGAIPPNPAELLQSNAMVQTLAELRKKYDVIIIDAPPLLPVTDSALLASEADGAVLVVRHGHATKDQVAGSVERLRAVEAPLLGLIMNMVPTKRGLGSYGYGYGYGYGYSPETANVKTTWRQRRTTAKAKKSEARKAPAAS